MNTIPIDQLKLESFSTVLGTRFRVYLDGSGCVELELAEARLLQAPRETGTRHETFSLIFEGPEDCLLAQRIYSFEHERIGRFDLFIVPVGQKSGSVQYQAVFNRVSTTN